MKAPNTKNGEKEGKYLTFKLGREEYGLELVRVREIIALMDITPVPLAPEYVRGVMNLRGRVIPVVDLRRKFGMQPTEDHDRKCIIVCDVQRNDQAIQMSILVDAVSEVLHISAADIEDAPSFSTGVETSFIHGIAKAKSGVKILLDIDIVLSAKAVSLQPVLAPPQLETAAAT
ncbi:MAG TPA: chemotaxis protein CheW [Polyangiaceae bacterium]|nr:chemotaxis protein CheW [Polyangiaceae bacterium]